MYEMRPQNDHKKKESHFRDQSTTPKSVMSCLNLSIVYSFRAVWGEREKKKAEEEKSCRVIWSRKLKDFFLSAFFCEHKNKGRASISIRIILVLTSSEGMCF